MGETLGVSVTEGSPWMGKTRTLIRWAYFDHEILIGMGFETAINLPR